MDLNVYAIYCLCKWAGEETLINTLRRVIIHRKTFNLENTTALLGPSYNCNRAQRASCHTAFVFTAQKTRHQPKPNRNDFNFVFLSSMRCQACRLHNHHNREARARANCFLSNHFHASAHCSYIFARKRPCHIFTSQHFSGLARENSWMITKWFGVVVMLTSFSMSALLKCTLLLASRIVSDEMCSNNTPLARECAFRQHRCSNVVAWMIWPFLTLSRLLLLLVSTVRRPCHFIVFIVITLSSSLSNWCYFYRERSDDISTTWITSQHLPAPRHYRTL